MDINEYFSYDPGLDFSATEGVAANYYVFACMTKECAEVYSALRPKYTLGFSMHDGYGRMVRLLCNG